MKQSIVHIALVVKDYDEAIQFYTQKLKFDLTQDTSLTDTKRWVLVSPRGSNGTSPAASTRSARADAADGPPDQANAGPD